MKEEDDKIIEWWVIVLVNHFLSLFQYSNVKILLAVLGRIGQTRDIRVIRSEVRRMHEGQSRCDFGLRNG